MTLPRRRAAIGDGRVPATPPGDPARWVPCVICKHLRIEHARNLHRCDVYADPQHPRTRCDCSGFRGRPALSGDRR